MISLFDFDYQHNHLHDVVDDRKDYFVGNCSYYYCCYSFDDDHYKVDYPMNLSIYRNDIDRNRDVDQDNHSSHNRLKMD